VFVGGSGVFVTVGVFVGGSVFVGEAVAVGVLVTVGVFVTVGVADGNGLGVGVNVLQLPGRKQESENWFEKLILKPRSRMTSSSNPEFTAPN
jgi:hypothetical protein